MVNFYHLIHQKSHILRLFEHIIEYFHCLFHTSDVGYSQITLAVFFLEIAPLHMGGDIIDHLREHCTLVEWTLYITHKLHLEHSLLQHDFLTSQSLTPPITTMIRPAKPMKKAE